MSTLRVEAAGLESFASRIGDLGRDVYAARSYIYGYADFSWQEEGLISLFRSAHESASDDLVDALRHLEDLLSESAFELFSAAHYYVNTDFAAAAELDRGYAAPVAWYQPPGWRETAAVPHGPLYAGSDPTHHLTDPGEPEASVGNGYLDLNAVFEPVSPASWLNWLLRETLGYDVIRSLTTPFTGDWRALARYGLALDRLGACLAEVGRNIQHATDEVDQYWTGNAASGATAYFAEVAAACHRAQSVLREVSVQYQEAAQGVWLLANQVAGIISAITDAVLVGGLGAGLGVLTSWTGIGGWAGGTLAASQVLRIQQLIQKAAGKIQAATTALQAIAGAVKALTDLDALKSLKLPAQPYDHPRQP
ncbi:type VII secretion target [Micromonosporaceae bacterium B7E4]